MQGKNGTAFTTSEELFSQFRVRAHSHCYSSTVTVPVHMRHLTADVQELLAPEAAARLTSMREWIVQSVSVSRWTDTWRAIALPLFA